MRLGLDSITNKFMAIMAAGFIILIAVFLVFEWESARTKEENQMLDKGRNLAVLLSHTLQDVAEGDMQSGINLPDGTRWSGEELRARLFNDQLRVRPESEVIAEKRRSDPDYETATATLYNGETIPLWQYELKYESDYDAYTDFRWQGIIDSLLEDERVVFAIPTAASSEPQFAGYIPTHNRLYSPEEGQSPDAWGDTGWLSQNNRSNRVFNDATGYQAAMNNEPGSFLLQEYDRLIDGTVVKTWDISYPLFLDGEHWGGVRVALSVQETEQVIAQARQSAILKYILLLVFVLAVLFGLTHYIVGRKLKRIVAAAANLNAGEADLTFRIPVQGKDELSRLGLEINRFMDTMQQVVQSIRDQSSQVNVNAARLKEGSEESSRLSARLSGAVQTIAVGAEAQAAGAGDSVRAMEEMAAGIGRIAESSGIASESSQVMLKEAEQGNRQAQAAVRQMDSLQASTTAVSDNINHLNLHSSSIRQMADLITRIAERTNILALNAAIEASRVGEQGRGFAVVASEIRKLAGEAAVSAEQIRGMTEQVLALTSAAVDHMQEGGRDVQQGVEAFSKLQQAFTSILYQARGVAAQLEEVSASTEQMAAGTEEVTASIEEMARVAAAASDQTGQAASDAAMQGKLAERTLELAASVSSLSGELEKAISRFRIK